MTHSPVNLNSDQHQILPFELDTLQTIAGHIAPNAVVLELGCSAGVLGPYLKTHRNCVTDGVVRAHAAGPEATLLQVGYRHVKALDQQSESITTLLPVGQYDVIVWENFLEVIADASVVLAQCQKWLKPHGKLIFTARNAGYYGLVAELLAGDIQYQLDGKQARNPVCGHTRLSLTQLLERAGWAVEPLIAQERQLPDSEFRPHAWINSLPPFDATC